MQCYNNPKSNKIILNWVFKNKKLNFVFKILVGIKICKKN